MIDFFYQCELKSLWIVIEANSVSLIDGIFGSKVCVNKKNNTFTPHAKSLNTKATIINIDIKKGTKANDKKWWLIF